MTLKMSKVVFKDGNRSKVAFGIVSFIDGFVKVVDQQGHTIMINKEHIIFIRDGDF